MRGSSLFHLTLGTLVVLIAGGAGQIAHNTRLAKPAPSRCSVRYPNTATLPDTPPLPVQAGSSRVILKVKRGMSAAAILGRIASTLMPTSPAPSVRETFPELAGLAVVGFSNPSDARTAVAALNRDPRVAYAELDATWTADQIGRLSTIPDDARYTEQWGLENTGQAVNNGRPGVEGVDIDAPAAWAIGKGGDGVVVAVIDSGVDYTHEDLAANMWTNEGEIPGNGVDDDGNGVVDDIHGFNAVDGSGDPDDDLGHGTHVAGIVGAEGDNGKGVAGVNWTARIMALKFLGPTGGGTTSDAIACIDYILKMRERGVNVRVANCSWGSTQQSQALGDAIEQAVGEGVVFVCAAGNSAEDTDRRPHYPSAYDSEGVISVAALAPDETLAPFSNYGRTTVDVAAPGVDILSTFPDGGYGFASGTSMASPFVAGVAALVAAREPNMSVRAIRSSVLDSAVGVNGFASRLATGGRLSGSAALAAAGRTARTQRARPVGLL